MPDTVTVYHPHALGPDGKPAHQEIPADLLERHVDQGWLKSEPQNEAVKTAQKAQAKATKAAQVEASRPVE